MSRPSIYALYERAVQSPAADVGFIAGVYRRRHRRPALTLREDFCGSAALAAAWVQSHRRRSALGVDLDPRPLAYAEATHRAALGRDAPRLRLARQSVLQATPGRFDVIAAYNFSVFVFHHRAQLLEYLRAAHRALAPGGLLFLDCFGGLTAQQVSLEPRELGGGLTYIWEQASFDPIQSRLVAYIHFRLADGTVRRRAFRYHWRLWQPVELTEALLEAGFASAEVYWEDRDREGEATHRFRRRARVEALPAWNAYVVGMRNSARRKSQR